MYNFRQLCSSSLRINRIFLHAKGFKTDVPNKKIISSIASIHNSNQTITDYVWADLDKWHDKTAVICFETGQSYTFGQIHEKCSFLAATLRNTLGLNKKDTVAVVLPNVPEFPIVFLGCLQAELVVTTVNPHYKSDEMAAQLKDSGAKLIFTTKGLKFCVDKAVSLLRENIPVVLSDPQLNDECLQTLSLSKLISDSGTSSFTPSCTSEDIACLPYSSGTTGLSKGVQLTHNNIVSNLRQMSSNNFALNFETKGNFQDIIPVFLPIFHIYGLVCIFLNFFSKGCKLVTVPKFVAPQFSRLLKTCRPTLIFAVPQLINLLINNTKIKYEDLSSIRTVVSAAAPLGSAVVGKFNKKTEGKISLLQMYGMTETSPLTLMQTSTQNKGIKIGGSGFLLPSTQCKVVPIDNDGSNETLGENQTGELVMKGPQVMKGYHNNSQATAQVLSQDGWLRTGDIGYYDEHRHFFITDRLKELIKVKGFQVAPAELEEILRNHASIQDVAVIGVPHPVQGEAPKAFVVLKKKSATKPEQIREYVASKVANYKRLVGGVVIMDKIPRNVSGKILRRQLKCL